MDEIEKLAEIIHRAANRAQKDFDTDYCSWNMAMAAAQSVIKYERESPIIEGPPFRTPEGHFDRAAWEHMRDYMSKRRAAERA